MKNKLAKKYFEEFSNKSLSSLKEMFAENVFLRDWEISANGKSEVLAANQKIFDSVKSICVSPIKMYEQGDTVVAELEILIDGKIIELVVDIIEFNESGKITSIKAYKGN